MSNIGTTLWTIGSYLLIAGLAGTFISAVAVALAGGAVGLGASPQSPAFNRTAAFFIRLTLISLAVTVCGVISCAGGCVAAK